MNRLQSVAVWIAAVSLAVLAVFTTLDYFKEPEAAKPHSITQQLWNETAAWSCVDAAFAVLQIEERDFNAIPEGGNLSIDDLLDQLDSIKSSCFDRFRFFDFSPFVAED